MLKRLEERKGESGFTLIELLIVVVVLGILGGIVLFGVGRFQADSEAAACQAESDTVKTAAKAYVAKNETIAGADNAARIATLVTADYLDATPTNAALITVAADGDVANTCPV